MKVHGFLVRFLLLVLLGAATGVACSQERKKPKITTSSNAQTVYKPLEIKETADKVKAAKTENVQSLPARKNPKTTAGKKNSAALKTGKKVIGKKPKAGTEKGQKRKTNVAAVKEKKSNKQAVRKPQSKQKKENSSAGKKKNTVQKKSKERRYIALKTNIPFLALSMHNLYNPQIQISAESETKRSIFREKDKTKRSKKESAQHSKSRNKSFVMTSVSAL